ncbi:MAG: DUF4870 domain-containing protein [Bacteroidetes bacterium]|nr:DUF4870 domain-containing protein [Bacteroidota bacterium]
MEYLQKPVNNLSSYSPREDEKEKASNGYLMSVIAVMAGLPLPIINLLASILFFLLNRKATYYVKWHCTQALLSQVTIFFMNSVAFGWTVKIITGNAPLTNTYLGYLFTIIIFNVTEIILNISAAIAVRKGHHKEWWFWGALTNRLIKPGKQ